MLVERSLLLRIELVGSEQREAGRTELFPEPLVPDAILFVDEFVSALVDGGKLLIGRLAVRRDFVDFSGNLRLESRHAHHEKFVEVRGEDRRELQALVERDAIVGRLGEDASIELEPGELPVDEQARIVQARRHRRHRRFCRDAQEQSTDFGHAHLGRRILARRTASDDVVTVRSRKCYTSYPHLPDVQSCWSEC